MCNISAALQPNKSDFPDHAPHPTLRMRFNACNLCRGHVQLISDSPSEAEGGANAHTTLIP